jgi:hypothetical protein
MQNSFVLPCSYCWNLLLLLEGVLPGSILTAVGAITRGSDCDHNGRVENQSRSWHADFLFSLSLLSRCSLSMACAPLYARSPPLQCQESAQSTLSAMLPVCTTPVPPLPPPVYWNQDFGDEIFQSLDSTWLRGKVLSAWELAFRDVIKVSKIDSRASWEAAFAGGSRSCRFHFFLNLQRGQVFFGGGYEGGQRVLGVVYQ